MKAMRLNMLAYIFKQVRLTKMLKEFFAYRPDG